VNDLRIDLDGDRRWYLPGDTVTGRAVWRLDADPEAVELRLFWHTRGKGTEDVEVVDQLRTEAAGAAGERAFAFRLPLGPYSFSGTLITLSWALELVALPGGELERVELVVAPTPVEVRLVSLGREPRGLSLHFGRPKGAGPENP
jgi:hypothetical protein